MKLSDGEKMIIFMLADMMKAQKSYSEIDPEFVTEAIGGGHNWALEWKYPGIFETTEADPEVVEEAGDILTMCSVVEYSITQLSPTDLAQIPAHERTVFLGFDGNHDPHHGVAIMFVEKMDRWAEFKGRSLNSHGTVLPKYRRMVVAWNAVRGANPMPLADIQTILAA